MQGVNYMILSRETIVEVLDEYYKRIYGEDCKVTGFQQRKHHNFTMFEVKTQTGSDERTPTDET